MRPCNQCRQPVQNEVFVCEKCEQYNAQHDLEAPRQIQANPAEDLEPGPNMTCDNSLRQTTNVFYAIIILLGAMIGLAVFSSLQAFFIGGLIGLVVSGVFLRLVFAGM